MRSVCPVSPAQWSEIPACGVVCLRQHPPTEDFSASCSVWFSLLLPLLSTLLFANLELIHLRL